MARLALPPEAERTPEQQAACAEVISGVRGRVPAPMIAWIRNPELATRAQKLGELLRYQTTLEKRWSEMAILVCARHYTAHFEWFAHKRDGLAAGLDPAIVAAIAARQEPVLENELERAIYAVSTTMMATGRLPKAVYQRGLAALGERGMVELVGLLGYYSMVALTLNAFQIGLPEGRMPELQDAIDDEA